MNCLNGAKYVEVVRGQKGEEVRILIKKIAVRKYNGVNAFRIHPNNNKDLNNNSMNAFSIHPDNNNEEYG